MQEVISTQIPSNAPSCSTGTHQIHQQSYHQQCVSSGGLLKIPILPGRYQPHQTWRATLDKLEEALRKRHLRSAERWSEHTKKLPPLAVGNHVRIQNQTGPHPTKWDKTGQIIGVRQHDQYIVRVDGSQGLKNTHTYVRTYLQTT